MPPPLIRIENLSKKYNHILAVDQLSLEIQSEGIYGFLGPNGAGKSTCLRMILSLIRPDSGIIELFGTNIKTHRAAIMKKIGCIVEKPDFYLFLTAIENLKMLAGLNDYKVTSLQLQQIINLTGLEGREHDNVKTFSHGMKQRLGLAQALLHDPELIILDEPTTGLDPQGIIDLRNLILKLKNEMGKTIVLSSHILSEVELIADAMIILHKGRSVVQGNVNELLNDAELIVSIESDDSSQCCRIINENYPESNPLIISPTIVSCQLSREQLPLMQKLLSNHPLQIYSFAYKRKLEDYFLKLTAS
jgi:ABC-type multidrug transport system ATPase subunit